MCGFPPSPETGHQLTSWSGDSKLPLALWLTSNLVYRLWTNVSWRDSFCSKIFILLWCSTTLVKATNSELEMKKYEFKNSLNRFTFISWWYFLCRCFNWRNKISQHNSTWRKVGSFSRLTHSAASVDRLAEAEIDGCHLKFGLQVVPLLGNLVRSYFPRQAHLLHDSSVNKTTQINGLKTNDNLHKITIWDHLVYRGLRCSVCLLWEMLVSASSWMETKFTKFTPS